MPDTLYDPSFEHDGCGVGFVAHVKGVRSRSILELGLEILRCMVHRGAFGSDPETGDGAGLLLQIPDALLRAELPNLPRAGDYGLGMVFLPKSINEQSRCRRIIERSVRQEGLKFLGWRHVPVDSSRIGRYARQTEPVVTQFVAERASGSSVAEFDRKLFVIRRVIERDVADEIGIADDHVFAITSFSSQTVVYKGLLLPHQVDAYYLDLQSPLFQTAIVLVHQRFSTNTSPSWPLAHPYRYLAHNGEINTIRGNRSWMHARQRGLTSLAYGTDLRKLHPLVSPTGSDSGSLDQAVELLLHSGKTLPEALMVLVPEAWENNEELPQALRDFYAFQKAAIEPWDGPASICFSDGKVVGGMLDRNGLRPARYTITHDDLVVYASETGVLQIAPERIKKLGRVRPGGTFLVDTTQGAIFTDQEVKEPICHYHPYATWLGEDQSDLAILAKTVKPQLFDGDLRLCQRIFGYTQEEIDIIIRPMMTDGVEPTGSMGNDTPLPPLSHRPQSIFNYFRQLFAQVTNPAIDPIRESLVMSLHDSIGVDASLLDSQPNGAHQVKLECPILSTGEFAVLSSWTDIGSPVRTLTLSTTFEISEASGALEVALGKLKLRASRAVEDGYGVIILSDRKVNSETAPIPSLLAVSAIHHHLVKEGIRSQVALVVDTGEAREIHHMACLMGYGASAVHPYLAMATCRSISEDAKVEASFIKSINKGLLKVMSKMGISTMRSYRGSQLFEALGLSQAFVDDYFTGTPSRIGGLSVGDLEREYRSLHRIALQPQSTSMDDGGVYHWRRLGERHSINPDSIVMLQRAVKENRYESFTAFCDAVEQSEEYASEIRGLLDIVPQRPAVDLAEVEPAKEIVRRFVTGAMSLGSLSREAHESLAVAMNSIGGRSNSGEGGEDEDRFLDNRRSAIKQIASGRFGVTTDYLVNADELQIKVAQGAKPGEGGQLPGNKVDEYIGRVRRTTPGVTLISPPPHHDIYSIEDLAQLIHDLKSVNSGASVSVKLVSEVGVGIIAAGVVKAHADVIVISGGDGGTGAAPLTSIRYTGLPWEMGIAETQQVLLMNGLRGRVKLQVDGQMKTGRDVVVGALLGADEFGFSTIPLVAQGCIMMRVCHLGTCPVGIATQDPELRRRFDGKPEYVVNYFFFVAEQVRKEMARLGFRTFEEMVGQVACLKPSGGSKHWKAKALDFSRILAPVTPVRADDLHHLARPKVFQPGELEIGFLSEVRRALETKRDLLSQSKITNRDRSFGAHISGEIVRWQRKTQGTVPKLTLMLQGSAGQSFGAFLVDGLNLELTGDANDYVAKGMSGGSIVMQLPPAARLDPARSVIAGNTVLYGATSGHVVMAGCAGERFAVRNSGATAVVEGVGDHACEYMTGGTIVVLGAFGRNVAAGMSGGYLYLRDPDGKLDKRLNKDSNLLVDSLGDDSELRDLIRQHLVLTGSQTARDQLANWDNVRNEYVRIVSADYKKVMESHRPLQEVARG